MLQRWIYHHHHCHHSNTKHLCYLPLLHGNQTPLSGLAAHSTAPKLFSVGYGMVMFVFSTNSHSRP